MNDREKERVDKLLKCGFISPQQLQVLMEKKKGATTQTGRKKTVSQNRVFGRYQVLEKLGQGGMGQVYKVYDPDIRKEIALKTILKSQKNESSVIRFIREARSMGRLSHPNIVNLYDIGVIDNTYYFTMELVEGKTLDEFIRSDKVTITKAVEIMKKITSALGHAHEQGIIHRDLKPANILLNKEGNPYLTDFGLAKETGSDTKLSKSGAPIGTVLYMSPEQALGERKKIDEQSDLYSLGIILYELLTGKTPFYGTNIHEIISQIVETPPMAPSRISKRVPPDLDRICLKAIAKKKYLRYKNCQALEKDLQSFLEGKPIEAAPQWFTYAIDWVVKNYQWCVIAVLVLLSLVLFIYNIDLSQKLRKDTPRKNVSVGKSPKEDLDQQYQVEKQVVIFLEKAQFHILKKNFYEACILYEMIVSKESLVSERFADKIAFARRQLAYHLPRLFVTNPILVNEQVESFAISPDSKYIALLQNNTIKVWDSEKETLISFSLPERVFKISFSPDGRTIACANNKSIFLYQFFSGNLTNLTQHLGNRFSPVRLIELAFDPISGKLASLQKDGRLLSLWDSLSGKQLKEINLGGTISPLTQIAVHPKNSLFVSGEDRGVIRLWDWQQKSYLAFYDLHRHAITSLAFSPDGKFLASGDEQGHIHVWKFSRDTLTPIQQLPYLAEVKSLSFSPDGKILVCNGQGTIRYWETTNWNIIDDITNRTVDNLVWKSDEELLFVDLNFSIYSWKKSKKYRPVFFKEHQKAVSSLFYSNSGKTIVSGGHDGMIIFWNLEKSSFKNFFTVQPVTGIAQTQNDNFVSSYGFSHSVRFWSESNRSVLWEYNRHPSEITALDCAVDGKLYASGDRRGNILLWSEKGPEADGQGKQRAFSVRNGVYALSFVPDGQTLLCGSKEGKIYLIPLHSNSPWSTLEAHSAAVSSMCFDHAGTVLASGSHDFSIRLWDWKNQKLLHTLRGHNAKVSSLKFFPQDDYIASAGADNKVYVWDYKAGYILDVLQGHAGDITCLDIAPDGKKLVSGGEDFCLCAWNIEPDQSISSLSPEEIQLRVIQAVGASYYKDFTKTMDVQQ